MGSRGQWQVDQHHTKKWLATSEFTAEQNSASFRLRDCCHLFYLLYSSRILMNSGSIRNTYHKQRLISKHRLKLGKLYFPLIEYCSSLGSFSFVFQIWKVDGKNTTLEEHVNEVLSWGHLFLFILWRGVTQTRILRFVPHIVFARRLLSL